MKKIFLIAAASVLAISASAQIKAFKQGTSIDNVEGYALPRTVITVKVTQEREVIYRGPYARFASQYLGVVTAPMSDKESYRIVDTKIGFFEEPDPKQVFAIDDKSGNPARVFNWLSLQEPLPERQFSKSSDVDAIVPFKNMGAELLSNGRLSAIEKSQEQMAADAADVIYRIRKKRIELITGDVGEAVYGAGMKAALEEMDKIEAEYVSLFIGKRYIETTTKYFTVVPEANKTRITAFRFSDTKGIVADTDLSGRPINIELGFENIANNLAVPVAKKTSRWVTYRIPQMTIAKLVDGQEILSTERMPIYQAGKTAEMPVVLGL